MSEDFYPFVDSGDPAPDNTHLTGGTSEPTTCANNDQEERPGQPTYTTRISVYDDMLSTPRVIVVEQQDVRTYLEDVTNTVHRTMKEQGGRLSLMIIRELVENFIHAEFSEPVISILDDGDTIRFADQGPGIHNKERAFEFGVTSADRTKKRYIRGTGAGLPMVQQYIEAAGGAISVEDNLGAGTVVTVSVNPQRVAEIERAVSRGAAVRSGHHDAGGAAHRQTDAAQGMQTGTHGMQQPNMTAAPAPFPSAMGAQPPQMPQGYMQGAPGLPMQPGADAKPNTAWPADGAGQAQPAMTYENPAAPGAYPPGAMGSQYPPYYQQQGYPWMPPAGGYPAFGYSYGNPNPYQNPAGYPQPLGGGYPMGDAQGVPTAGMQQAAQPAEPYVTERGTLALRFIAQNGKGGPTDLTRAVGNSDATWSRELDTLSGTGLIYKRGQKYVLTELGQGWANSH